MSDLFGKRPLEGRPPSEQQREQREQQIKVLIEQHAALRRRESDRAEARRLSRALQAELERTLPANVPLHRRGFGVMDEDGA
jgi:hypothetical protein